MRKFKAGQLIVTEGEKQMSLSNRKTQAWEWVVAIALVAVIFLLFFYKGGDGIISPNVKISSRASLVRSDYVLQIVNSGSKPLFNVAVKTDGWANPVVVSKQLNVGSTVEAGWAELPEGCQKNKKYKITADGYLMSTEYTIPAQ